MTEADKYLPAAAVGKQTRVICKVLIPPNVNRQSYAHHLQDHDGEITETMSEREESSRPGKGRNNGQQSGLWCVLSAISKIRIKVLKGKTWWVVVFCTL